MSSRQRTRTLATVTEAIAAHGDPRLDIAVTDLRAAAPRFLEAAQRMQDARPSSLGAASYDSPSVTASGLSDPTLRLAVTPDRFASDRMMLDVALHTLTKYARHAPRHAPKVCAAAHNLRRIIEVWTPKAPTDRQRRQVEHANDRGLCDHHRTVHLVEPEAHTGTVSGNLAVSMALCQPCYDHVRNHGKLPSAEWMERRARTGKNEGVRA